MAQGKFITFEGGEGSGKSTQAHLLSRQLEASGIDVVLTREPGGSAFAEQVRALILGPGTAAHAPLSEALLFSAARADHLDKTIRPALGAGRWVICDRFSDSTRVYQGAAGGLDDAVLDALERIVMQASKPDLTIILDVAPTIGLRRAGDRNLAAPQPAATPDTYEQRDLDFHEKLRAGYRAIAAADPARCVLIDGARPVDDIAADVWAAVAGRLLGAGQ